MKYQIVPLKGTEQVNINGVRFGDKTFMFWMKKNTRMVNRVFVIFDKKYESIQIPDGVIVLDLVSLSNYEDLKMAIVIFREILKNNGIDLQIQFIVDNEEKKKIASSLASDLGVSYSINFVNDKKIDDLENRLQDNREVTASGSRTIMAGNNGKTVVTIDGNGDKAYVNDELVSIEEKKANKLREWKMDPVMYAKISTMSNEEIDRLLLESVTMNKTEYNMRKADYYKANNEVDEVSLSKASYEGGRVNKELGIVENNVSSNNLYSSIYKNYMGGVEVVNPEVSNVSIGSNGVSNTSSSTVRVDNSISQLVNDKGEVREYYIDTEGNIYTDDDKVIGHVGSDGYYVNYDNNMLYNNGVVLGSIGDFKTKKRNSNVYVKPKVKTLEEKKDLKSGGFVSLPVVMFVLSALLLVASLVLLFVLK